MSELQLNPWAILSATVAAFLIGGVWYSPLLFAKGWMEASGVSEEQARQGSPAKVFGGAFALTLVMAANLAAFLGPKADLAFGVFAGAAAGLGWVAMALGVTYLFEHRSLKLFLINAGYQVVTFTVMGAILGAWR
jgi:hypothetical protein